MMAGMLAGSTMSGGRMIMFRWLKKDDKILAFDSNRAAFQYACGNLPNKLLLEATIPALIEEAGGIDREGGRTFRLSIADKNGGYGMWASTLKDAAGYPAEGDLVGFKIVRIASDLPDGMNIIGFIAVKLLPILVTGKGWKIACSYTPEEMKRRVRFSF